MALGYQTNLPHAYRCANHPEREGVGICVSCRSVVCVECTTKIDRMNYCIRCLDAASEPAKRARPENRAQETVLGIPLLVVSFILTVGVFGLLALVLAALRGQGGVTAG
jgi:hypothetical protein